MHASRNLRNIGNRSCFLLLMLAYLRRTFPRSRGAVQRSARRAHRARARCRYCVAATPSSSAAISIARFDGAGSSALIDRAEVAQPIDDDARGTGRVLDDDDLAVLADLGA